MKNESGVVILAVVFIGLFALLIGASIGKNVQRVVDEKAIQGILGK